MTCYVLVWFVSGGWYSSCSDTRSLFTRHMDQDGMNLKIPNCFMEIVCGNDYLAGQQRSTLRHALRKVVRFKHRSLIDKETLFV